MNQQTRQAPRIAAALCTASFLLAAGAAVGATSASARPDPGPRRVVSTADDSLHCTLHRVGTQYARCDDLTGNGVSAPSWVPGS